MAASCSRLAISCLVTVYNELIRRRKLPASAAQEVAPKNALTRAVGVYEHCEAETLVIDVAEGDRILLCSDGLYRCFEGAEGSTDELRVALFGDDGQQVADDLVTRANELGGKDNITAAVVTLGRVGEYDSRVLVSLSAKRRALAQSRRFALLDERELLRVLSMTEVQSFYPGGVIIEQDTLGAEMYVVSSGSVAVCRAGSQVAELSAGEHFGEMALLRNRPRSADAHAVSLTELLTTRDLGLSREELELPDLSHAVFSDEQDARITLRPASCLPWTAASSDLSPTLRPPPAAEFASVS